MIILNRFKFSREAMLFDSPLYLIKAFLGIMISYVVFSQHSIVGNDMISVLFGMMLSLEPVNISGIKSGVAQFEATILGGLVTAIIVSIAGVNMFTVPLAVMLTLYISILLDWKNISPVAFFTSIYMTQLIQYTGAGDPSMLLTFRLRIMALGSGVLVALLLNFIFSLVFYKSMVCKRITYLFEKFVMNVEYFENVLQTKDSEAIRQLKSEVSGLFRDIDFIYGHVNDLNKEKRKTETASKYLVVISELRLLNHYFFDLLVQAFDETPTPPIKEAYIEDLGRLKTVMRQSVIEKDCVAFPQEVTFKGKTFFKIAECIKRMSA